MEITPQASVQSDSHLSYLSKHSVHDNLDCTSVSDKMYHCDIFQSEETTRLDGKIPILPCNLKEDSQ